MRAFRWLSVATLVGVLVAIPVAAGADGGSYIELDGTHYLPGETAVGIAYVFVPERKQVLFERGPFYAFLAPNVDTVREDRPLPDGVIRVGTFSIEHEKGRSSSSASRSRFLTSPAPSTQSRSATTPARSPDSASRSPGSSRSSRRRGKGACSRSSRAWTPGSSVCVTNSGRPSAPLRSSGRSCSQAKPSVGACRRS